MKHKKTLLLKYFWSPTCSDCHLFNQIFNRLIDTYRNDSIVEKINIDEHMEKAEEFAVLSTPSLLIFSNGQEIQRFVEDYSSERIENAINALLHKDNQGCTYDN